MEKKTAEKKTTKSEGKYYEGLGKRKTSAARVRIYKATRSDFSINEKSVDEYFKTEELRNLIKEPFEILKATEKFKTTVLVNGGGIHSQAEAIRHGLSRALNLYNTEFRIPLKRKGLLTRDSRMKERKKFGLKKARRAPQWSKR